MVQPTVNVGRVLAILLLSGPGLLVPLEAAARDVCPTVSPATVLPDPSVAVEIDPGEPLAQIEDRLEQLAATISDRSQVTQIRRIPDPLPVDASDAWVWQFGYAPDPQFLGDPIEQISPRYEAILCIGTKVPEVIGQPIVQARDALNARGLVVASRTDGDWSVTALRPRPGTLVQFGTAVELVGEIELVDVPALIGRPFEEADAVADEAGLAVVPSPFEGEATGFWGTVRNQKPGAGDLAAAGTSIEADVDVLVEVPNVVGGTVGEADEVLTAAGLLLATFAEPSERVVDQSPPAGQRTIWGSSVELEIDVPPPNTDSLVPDLTDMTAEQARAAIAQAGLVLNVLLESAPPGAVPGTVLRQDPAPGTEVGAGSPVDAIFGPLVEVPDLRDRTRDQAAEALDQVQLSLQAPEGSGGGEVVTGQDPPAGEFVPLGSPVTVQLSSAVVSTDESGIPPWVWAAGGAVVLVAGSAAVSARSARGRRDRRWVEEHVTTEGHPGPSSQDVYPAPGAAPSLSVRLEPHAGTTAEDLTEGGTDEHRQPQPGR
jgi:beta-lactam-binding protein with PASTA domain